jgi:beta-glucosidase
MNNEYPFQNSALSLDERVRDLLSRLTREEKISFLAPLQPAVERLGLGAYMAGGEGAHGYVGRGGPATTFPQTHGLAASWDRELLARAGEVTGTEARGYYNRDAGMGGIELFCPTIDMERDPRWGRNEEAYGEDPYLTGELSSSYIRGAQGEDPFYLRVTCGPKHFFANNNEKDRGFCSCSVPPRAMNEYYLAPFKAAFVQGKAKSLMTAYNEVNGIPMMLHPIVREKVKGEWGCDGHIVTDGGDFVQTVNFHHYFATHAETLAAALKAGADEMLDGPGEVIPAAREALEKGLITEAELDEAVANLLRVRFRLGLFDGEKCPYHRIGGGDLNTEASKNLAREAVQKSVVLLKNEGDLLPLSPEATARRKILVTGPIADVVYRDWYSGTPGYEYTALAGIREQYPKDEVIHADHRDVVSFTTAAGLPLVLAGEDAVLSAGKPGESPARFYLEDWGWGAYTFQSLDNRRYLDIPRKPEPNPMAGPDAPVPEIPEPWVDRVKAAAETTFNWFVGTMYNLVPQGGGLYLWKTWNNRRLFAPSAGGSLEIKNDGREYEEALFKMNLETRGLDAVTEAAKTADAAFVLVGNDPLINGREEQDRPSLDLPPKQRELIELVAGLTPRTILGIIASYPYTCGREIARVPAAFWAAHGLQELGRGLADVLSGQVSPAGRLPMTWYEDEKQLPPMMEYDIIAARSTYQYFPGKVLFPFGYGLSYAGFAYSNLRTDRSAAAEGDTVTVSFTLKNTGKRRAEEVPQLYATISGSRSPRPLKTLRGFTRIALDPGEEKTLSFPVEVKELALWDLTRDRFCVENGYCTLSLGASSGDIRLTGGFALQGETIPPREGKKGVHGQNFDDQRDCYLHEKRGSAIAAVFNRRDGAWTRYGDYDFGGGAETLAAIVSGSPGSRIEIRLDAPEGLLAGCMDLPNTEDLTFLRDKPDSFRHVASWARTETAIRGVTGVHDLYLVFYGAAGLWRFTLE